MPETALKARAHGAKALMDESLGIAQGIKDLRMILSGKAKRDQMSNKAMLELFQNHSRTYMVIPS